jgi:hypothetical protein
LDSVLTINANVVGARINKLARGVTVNKSVRVSLCMYVCMYVKTGDVGQ